MRLRHSITVMVRSPQQTGAPLPPEPSKISIELVWRCACLVLFAIIAISALHLARDHHLGMRASQDAVAERQRAERLITSCKQFLDEEPKPAVGPGRPASAPSSTSQAKPDDAKQLARAECTRLTATSLLLVARNELATPTEPPRISIPMRLLFSEDGPSAIFYKLLIGALYAILIAAASVIILRAVESKYLVDEPFSKVADRVSSFFGSASPSKAGTSSQSLINGLTTAAIATPVVLGMTVAFTTTDLTVPVRAEAADLELRPTFSDTPDLPIKTTLSIEAKPVTLTLNVKDPETPVKLPIGPLTVPVEFRGTGPVAVPTPPIQSTLDQGRFIQILSQQSEINNSLLVIASRSSDSPQIKLALERWSELTAEHSATLRAIQQSMEISNQALKSTNSALSQRVVGGGAN
jgi:hypothetical protein